LARFRGEPLQLTGKRALVMGLGTRQGGVGVTRYLIDQGAEVTVTDLGDAESLQPSLDALRDLPVNYRLGEHVNEDFDNAEVIVRNPGVPVDSPWLERARSRGTPIEMEMSLFFRACPAPIIGITGTKGKTTTATLCASIFALSRPDTVLAGNMGTSALDQLDRIESDTPVILELSSWQLEGLALYEMSPDIAVLTNVSEDHLNRYPSMAAYIEAKRHITRFQSVDDTFIVNRNDHDCWESRKMTRARVIPFGYLHTDEDGAGVEHGHLYWQRAGIRSPLIDASEIPLPGDHVVSNALAAAATSLLGGVRLHDVRAALREAQNVPHRQELVATINGVDYINDTTATAPAAAIAALETFHDREIVLIAGGAGKKTNLQRFAALAADRAAWIVLLEGEETPRLQELLAAAGAERIIGPLSSIGSAVEQATSKAMPGAVVLLSPGCASFGMFRDEFDRGEQFRAAVHQLAGTRRGGGAA
jgi:UDP-N-acetylmuramoylalanine--D-glutamate ligase